MWEQLRKTALLGTDRSALDFGTNAAPELLALAETLDPADREGSILALAAACSVFRTAGQVAGHLEVEADVAPADAQPRCSPAAAIRLEGMLVGRRHELLGEWLAVAAQRGLRVREEALPALLDLGTRNAAVREAISAVIGARGGWLASQNNDWHYALPVQMEQAEEIWQTGAKAQRQILLHRLRRRDPRQARELLQSTWESEAAGDRVQFLTAFEKALPEDEPFLESALDDRSGHVRFRAAQLLATLPNSAYAERAVERAHQFIQFDAPRLHVMPPAALDEAWVRDGFTPKATNYQNVGERAWWLIQVVASVPLQRWESDFGIGPAELPAAVRKHEWLEALRLGFAEAARREAHTEWILALLEVPESPNFSHASLFRLLAPEARETLALTLLESEKLSDAAANRLQNLLDKPHAWSVELTRALLRHLRGAFQDKLGHKRAPRLAALLQLLARCAPPEMTGDIEAIWDKAAPEWEAWQRIIEGDVMPQLHFRRDMLLELQRPDSTS